MRARVVEKREVAKGTLLVLFDLLGFLRDHLTDGLRSYEYLVAGPPPMVDATGETLRSAGVPEERVSADRFSGH